MKRISILLPCRNEENNVEPISDAIISILRNFEGIYEYEIIFIDNYSTDNTRNKLRVLCAKNNRIKAIFNARNFHYTSGFYGLLQATGDAVITMAADFQEPPSLILDFIKEWEKGAKIVCGVKKSSKENYILYKLRSLYYILLKKFSEGDVIEHFTGFGLYDREFIEVLRNLNDPCPYMRGFVAELGYKIKIVEYVQQKRKSGKSKSSFFRLYNTAMRSFTTYTKVGIRMATVSGLIVSLLCVIVALIYFIFKLLNWNEISWGVAPLICGFFFVSGLQLVFIGLLGEYILNINSRIMNRPYVIEEKRLNFDDGEKYFHED